MVLILDHVFGALSDPTRRAVLERLEAGPATAGALVAPFAISGAAISRHLKVLERAGLIARERVGTSQVFRLAPGGLEGAAGWIARQESQGQNGKPRLRVGAADDGAVSLVVTRLFDAAPALLFDAFADGAQWARWAGPEGVDAAVRADAREGGAWEMVLRDARGERRAGGVYRAVEPPSRLAFTWRWAHGATETVVTVAIRAVGARAEVTLRQDGFASAADRDAHAAGWRASLARLERVVA